MQKNFLPRFLLYFFSRLLQQTNNIFFLGLSVENRYKFLGLIIVPPEWSMISFCVEMIFEHIDPSPYASHIMCCAFFYEISGRYLQKQGRNNDGNTESIFFDYMEGKNKKYVF